MMINTFRRRSVLLYAAVLLLLPLVSRAQEWTGWTVVYQERGGAILTSFDLSNQDCFSDRSRSFFRIRNDFNEKVTGILKFDYVDCNGRMNTLSRSFSFEGAGMYQDKDNWISHKPKTEITKVRIEGLEFPGRQQHQQEVADHHGNEGEHHGGNYSRQNTPPEQGDNNLDHPRAKPQEDRDSQLSSEHDKASQQPLSITDQISRDENQKEQQLDDLSRKRTARMSSIDASIFQNQIQMIHSQMDAGFNVLSAEAGGPAGYLEACPDCNGTGLIACSHCNGTGIIKCMNCDGTGYVQCPSCHGTGRFGNMTCMFCNGTGKVECNMCQGKGGSFCNYCSGIGYSICQKCNGTGLLFVMGTPPPVATDNNYNSHEQGSYQSQANRDGHDDHNHQGGNNRDYGSESYSSHNEKDHSYQNGKGYPDKPMRAEDIIDRFIDNTGGADQWNKIHTLTREVNEKMHGPDDRDSERIIERKDSLYYKWPDRQRRVNDYTGRTSVEAYDGRDAWRMSLSAHDPGPHKVQWSHAMIFNFNTKTLDFLNYAQKGSQVQWTGFDNVEGEAVDVLKMNHENGTWEYDYFDRDSYYLVYLKFFEPVPGKPDEETDIRLGDYHRVEGLMFPFYAEISSDRMHTEYYTMDIQINLPLDDSLFLFPGNYREHGK